MERIIQESYFYYRRILDNPKRSAFNAPYTGIDMKPADYRVRFYREWQEPRDLKTYWIHHFETDLQIYSAVDLHEKARELTLLYRNQIEETIREHPHFRTSLRPITIHSQYEIINRMVEKSDLAGVGPMAGVAGAVAEFIGRGLMPYTKELIIENGGDIFMKSKRNRTILIYAGENSPFEDKLRIKLRERKEPYGICTSSATIGHSISFGNTDATVVIARSAVTADVFATAVGNMVKSVHDIDGALEFLRSCNEITGTLILIGDKLAVSGDIEFA